MQEECFDKKKQYLLQELKKLNRRIYQWYLERTHLPYKQIIKMLWWSNLWKEAKILFKELNIHLYGKLTCEMCFQGFYTTQLHVFQLHHSNGGGYNWEEMFDPDCIQLVHKHCHAQFHGKLNNKWRGE